MSTQKQEIYAVERFGTAMLDRLRANSHKAYWRGAENVSPLMIDQGYALMRGECAELARAMTDRDEDAIRKEAADVANFAMMIYDLTFEQAARARGRQGGRMSFLDKF